MKKLVLLALILSILGSMYGQEGPQLPFSWKANTKTGSGSALYTSKTYDEVWLAAKKYIQLKANLLSSDKETGILTTNLDNSKWVIETSPEGISITIVSEFLRQKYSWRQKEEYKAIFESVAVLLYGPDVLPKKGKK